MPKVCGDVPWMRPRARIVSRRRNRRNNTDPCTGLDCRQLAMFVGKEVKGRSNH